MHTRTQIPDLTPADPPVSSGRCCLITFSCWPSLYSKPLSGNGQSIESIYHQRHRFQVPLCRGKKAGVGQEQCFVWWHSVARVQVSRAEKKMLPGRCLGTCGGASTLGKQPVACPSWLGPNLPCGAHSLPGKRQTCCPCWWLRGAGCDGAPAR